MIKKYGNGITLTKNVMKDIIKVIISLENRGISWKETSRKINRQEGGLLNFFGLLMNLIYH